jgi:parvulin-like peptidyl-prolyl isomerase
MEEARTIALGLPQDTRGFGEHAMTYSEEATSRFKGGDIGWLEAGTSASRWPDAVVKAGFALKNNGDTSDVIETPEGFYLLKKIDAREPTVRSLDGRLRSTLESALLKEKRSAIEVGLKQQWDESLNVRIHNDVLGALRFQSPKDPAEAPVALPAGP